MIFTFRSKAASELIMLGQHAVPVLEIAGKSIGGEVEKKGVFTPEQVPDAIARLERALGTEQAPAFDEDDPAQAEKAAQYVGLKQRAFPLLDMLRAAQKKNVNVTWES